MNKHLAENLHCSYLDALERSSQESGEGTSSRKTRRGGRSRDNSAKDSRDDDSESSEDLYTFDWPEDSNSSTNNESKRLVSTKKNIFFCFAQLVFVF